MNLVYRHPSGGRLFQGGAKDTKNIPLLDAKKIKAVVFTAKENNNFSLPDRFDVLRVRLRDKLNPDEAEIIRYWNAADQISERVVSYLLNGEDVLSSCALGLNRSGLISAFTLVKLGFTGTEAISMIRRARGMGALYNPAFRRIIRAFAKATPSGH